MYIKYLQSGGIITNYNCTSSCAHCLYKCSPERKKQYIDSKILLDNILKIRELGCNSVHIGGGEPFLDINSLTMVIAIAKEMNMNIEYVETNSSWFKDQDSACKILDELMFHGLDCVLVSISPFHNEHVPFNKVKGVMDACRRVGIAVFPWVMGFYNEINSFDGSRPHSLSEYERRFGKNYLMNILSRYWVHMGGRALTSYAKILPRKDYREILTLYQNPCSELADTSHFHFDFHGDYIPGLCSGLKIHRDDLGHPLPGESYPFLTELYTYGIRGLFDAATQEYGYEVKDGYIHKCHLCFDIRTHLVLQKNLQSKDLGPVEFYMSI